VIDPATAASAVAGRLVPDYLLGGLLGLLIGIGLAAAREALVPTLVGHAALARALGAPVLADLPGPPQRCQRKDITATARHVELAALAAEVVRVEVISLDETVDISGFVALLDHELTSAAVHRADLLAVAGRRGTGLVVIAPDVVHRTSLDPARNLMHITGWPLLGVVVFRPDGRSLLPRPVRELPHLPAEWLRSSRGRGTSEDEGERHEDAAVNRR
jgi:hypothetical protein